MSQQVPIRRATVPEIRARKGAAKIVCLTAYTAPMAALFDPYVDLLLVGDSLGMVAHGLENTLPVTLEAMLLHGQAVARGARRALIVVDLPFGSYEASPEQAFAAAARVLKETGAQAVKLEGGESMADTVAFLTARGVPVMGHVGLRPQAVHVDGGFKAKGGKAGEAEQVLTDARAIDRAGAFAIVLEGVAAELADQATRAIAAPSIGIGASAGCDGQILVSDDMLGLFERAPKFARRYADLRGIVAAAAEAYAADVRAGRFPAEAELYRPKRR